MFGFINDYLELDTAVLGINRRNLEYIKRYNAKVYKKYVNNKLLNKRILKKYNLPYPKVLKIIRRPEDINKINWENLPKSFVIKPGRGSRGRGILVVFGKRKNKLEWIAADGKVYTVGMLEERLRNIINGYYSMGRRKDVAFIEERIKVHPVLKPYTYKGIPDIRVIVFKRVPVMAMLRLPTKRSKGTANLHAGAVAVGIDMRFGVTTKAIVLKEVDLLGDQYDSPTHHPDAEYLTLSGLQIPYWNKVLELAVNSQVASKLGYVGADIAIDRDRGPLVLEINAHPGLGIQVANGFGLRERLESVKNLKVYSVPRAISIAKSLFGGEIEEEVEALTGKQIIGIVEQITLKAPLSLRRKLKKMGKKAISEHTLKAKVDTGALFSSIDYDVALRLGYVGLEKYKDLITTIFKTRQEARDRLQEVIKEEVSEDIKGFKIVRNANGVSIRPVVTIPTYLAEEWVDINYTVSDRKQLIYNVLLGRKDLKNSLIDPSRKKIQRTMISGKKSH